MTQKYQVIARKYRPQSFRDVVGQEAAVTTLKNAIRFDKVAHAYLFCGSRGVGKTTIARLFAKTLNCQSPTADLEPCNECPSCREITAGQSLDVIEIDGASNRGIDDIRQINETIGYAPSHGKYKIYIIDEVHMLTKEAFNALLKTLEEPPERAKFFFATTEAHKVLPTIISRCQRFDLARIKPDRIVSKLKHIAENLQREVDADALQLIASFSEGSLRDAESLLDQILCFAENKVTAATVRDSLGLVPEELFVKLDQAFSQSNLSFAFELVEELFQMGKDLGHFLEQLIEHYRRVALCRTVGEKGVPPELSAQSMNAARLYTQPQCLYILDLLLTSESQFQKSAFQRISLESILLQIIRSKNRIPIEVLVRRLSELEETLKKDPSEPLSPPHAEQLAPPEPKAPAPVALPEIPPATAPIEEISPIEPPIPQIDRLPLPPLEVLEEKVSETPALNPPALPSSLPKKAEAALKKEKTAPPAPEPSAPTTPSKHPSYYDTLMRFAAIELEGTFKNN